MACITKFLGRLLIATVIVSSAYLHLTKPETFTQGLENNYNQLTQCAAKYAPGFLPAAQTINWTLWAKILGLFEAMIALLIIFGDGLGGVLLFLSLIVSGAFDYCKICSFLQWEASKQLQFARYLLFVGVSLTLICCGSCQKSCNSPCKQSSKQKCKQACKQKCNKSGVKQGKCCGKPNCQCGQNCKCGKNGNGKCC